MNLNIELFSGGDLIDLNNEFIKDLYKTFTLISYNFKININNIKNYIQKIRIYYQRLIKNIIQNLTKNKIKYIKNKIIMQIFSNYIFEDNDIDLI